MPDLALQMIKKSNGQTLMALSQETGLARLQQSLARKAT
jgi:hypothetical protein